MAILTVVVVVVIDRPVPVQDFQPIDRPGHDLWSRQSEQGSPHGCGYTMTQHGWKRREFSAGTITVRMDCHFPAGMVTDRMPHPFPADAFTGRTSRQNGICIHHKHRQTS